MTRPVVISGREMGGGVGLMAKLIDVSNGRNSGERERGYRENSRDQKKKSIVPSHHHKIGMKGRSSASLVSTCTTMAARSLYRHVQFRCFTSILRKTPEN